MPEIIISVENKDAQLRAPATIVTGNSDYTVRFMFDSEWDDYEQKTAEFRYWRNGERKKDEVLFSGDTVAVPILRDIDEVEIGVYAGNLHTSTGARIPCARSITDGDAVHDPPTPDVYDQLMEYLAGLQGGGPQIGALSTVLSGAMLADISNLTYEELPSTIPIVEGGWSDGVGTKIYPTPPNIPNNRCRSDKIYRIPSGKTATISTTASNIQAYYRTCTDNRVITGQYGWYNFPVVIDNSNSASDIYIAFTFHASGDTTITPSDVGVVTSELS